MESGVLTKCIMIYLYDCGKRLARRHSESALKPLFSATVYVSGSCRQPCSKAFRHLKDFPARSNANQKQRKSWCQESKILSSTIYLPASTVTFGKGECQESR